MSPAKIHPGQWQTVAARELEQEIARAERRQFLKSIAGWAKDLTAVAILGALITGYFYFSPAFPEGLSFLRGAHIRVVSQ